MTRAAHSFADFARRVAGGGDDLPAPVVRVSHLSLDDVARAVPAGALFARTSWTEGEDLATGCLLWLGAGTGAPADFDRALRGRVTTGGEGEPALRWSELVPLRTDDVVDVLRQAGVPETCDVHEYRFGSELDAMAFLFLRSRRETVPPIAEADRGSNLEHLLDVRLPLTIRLGSTRMRLDDVLRLTAGSVVELDQREDEPLEVLANGRVVAHGEVVVIDERFGLRITQVGSVEERVRSV